MSQSSISLRSIGITSKGSSQSFTRLSQSSSFLDAYEAQTKQEYHNLAKTTVDNNELHPSFMELAYAANQAK